MCTRDARQTLRHTQPIGHLFCFGQPGASVRGQEGDPGDFLSHTGVLAIRMNERVRLSNNIFTDIGTITLRDGGRKGGARRVTAAQRSTGCLKTRAPSAGTPQRVDRRNCAPREAARV